MSRSSRLLAACGMAIALVAGLLFSSSPAEARFFFGYGFIHPVFYPQPVFYRPYYLPPPPPVYVAPRVAYIAPPPVTYGYYGYGYHRVVHRYYHHRVVHKVTVHHAACSCSCCPQ